MSVLNGLKLFLSTLSLRRATARRDSRQQPAGISIHALLAESDSAPRFAPTASRNFYPRSPCGERQRAEIRANSQQEFLSTLSLRRATFSGSDSPSSKYISIHALLAESDVSFMLYDTSSLIFLSTLSLRRATSVLWMAPSRLLFLSTLSLRRATMGCIP